MLEFFASADGAVASTSTSAPVKRSEHTSSSSSSSSSVGCGGGDSMLLTREDIVRCKQEALRTVRVPTSIIQMVTDLRSYLQEKMEPTVYVSDRRLVKSIQLLQVRLSCVCGRVGGGRG